MVFSSGGSTMQWRPTTTSSWTTTTTSSVEPGKCPSHQWQRQQQRQHLQWFNDISGGFGFSGISRGTSLFSSLVTTVSPCPGPPTTIHHPHFCYKIHLFHIDAIFIRSSLCRIYRSTMLPVKLQKSILFTLILSSKSPTSPSNILNLQGWKEMAVEQNPKVQVI